MSQSSRIFIAIKRYLINCNLHGIRYLVEDGFHWTERVFWLITCALCWFGCAVMVKDSVDGFYNRPVTFTVETTYVDWDTDFPSVSVCSRSHPNSELKAATMISEMYGSKIAYPRTLSWLFTWGMKSDRKSRALLSKLTPDDVVRIYKEAAVNCSTLLTKCYWESTLEFNCCDEFLPLHTAQGLCYMFNSRHTRPDDPLKRFIMNQTTGPGELTIGLAASSFASPAPGSVTTIEILVDGNWVIPGQLNGVANPIITSLFEISTVYFTLEDTFNEDGLKHIPPERRGCRFSDETEDFYTYERYSRSGCIIQVQMKSMLKYCHCISHLYPHKDASLICNFTGQQCLMENQNHILATDNLDDHCLPDCESRLLALPTSRSKRYVVRSLLDLVVAVGSAAGLFMGAGILSLVEIPYWLLLRHGP